MPLARSLGVHSEPVCVPAWKRLTVRLGDHLEPRFRVTAERHRRGPSARFRTWRQLATRGTDASGAATDRAGRRALFHATCIRDAPLADEIRAGRVLDRRPRRAPRQDDRLVRRAQLPGPQLHARRDEGRRPRVLLSLELPRARHRRHRRGVARRRIRTPPSSIRKSPYYDPKSTRESPRWMQRRRAARREDAAGAARRAARPPRRSPTW